ncbi:MAG: CDP-alcohol phosphatidyltransferase family protein [Deltaproteobacteria bacterium]|nr:CDP-alcohol phosphatidyltransferase family protein [Deltaproteobacteria bacterium]
MSLADLLTVSRLVLVPFFLFAFLRGDYFLAFILFAIAAFTDLVDGTVARILKRQTRFGAVLDPIADKVLMVTTVACLLVLKIIPLWFFILLAVRDVMILSGLAWLKVKKIQVPLHPLKTSKFATLSNIAMVVFGFLTFLGHPLQLWFHIFLFISTLLIFVSGWQYASIGFGILKRT